MDPNHLSCFVHNFSPGRVGYRKYPLARSNPFPGYIFFEAVRNLLRDEDNFSFLGALGARRVNFLSSISLGINFNTSPILIPPRAINSRISRFLGLMVRKMISSTTSFSRMVQRIGPGGRYSFFSIRVSQGLRKLGSRLWVMKLKKEVSWEYRVRLVNCLVCWLMCVRKERTSSGVREFRSLSPNRIIISTINSLENWVSLLARYPRFRI